MPSPPGSTAAWWGLSRLKQSVKLPTMRGGTCEGETIKLRLAWSLLFILGGKFGTTANHYAVEHDSPKKYSRALRASLPLLYWKIMGLYPIKNCIKIEGVLRALRRYLLRLKAFLLVQMLTGARASSLSSCAIVCPTLAPGTINNAQITVSLRVCGEKNPLWKHAFTGIQM